MSGDGRLAPTAFRAELNQIWALPAKQKETQSEQLTFEQKTQILKVVADTFSSVMQDQAMQVGRGVAKGTEKFAADIVELGVATVKTTHDVAKATIEANKRLNRFDSNLKSNPTQAMEDVAQAGVETANILVAGKHVVHTIDKLGNNVMHYAKETAAGKRNPINDLGNAVVKSYQHWDGLSTESKAELGTELLLGFVPLERAATATKAIAGMVRSIRTSRIEEIRALSHQIDEGLAVRDTWLVKYKRRAGAGGNWTVIDEHPSPEVVGQLKKQSCAWAVGEMLSEGAIDQATLISKLGCPGDPLELPALLGPGWKGDCVSHELLDQLLKGGSWAAELRELMGRRYRRLELGHLVVVDGINEAGNIMIRDPAERTKYAMTRSDFLTHWTGIAVYRKPK